MGDGKMLAEKKRKPKPSAEQFYVEMRTHSKEIMRETPSFLHHRRRKLYRPSTSSMEAQETAFGAEGHRIHV